MKKRNPHNIIYYTVLISTTIFLAKQSNYPLEEISKMVKMDSAFVNLVLLSKTKNFKLSEYSKNVLELSDRVKNNANYIFSNEDLLLFYNFLMDLNQNYIDSIMKTVREEYKKGNVK